MIQCLDMICGLQHSHQNLIAEQQYRTDFTELPNP